MKASLKIIKDMEREFNYKMVIDLKVYSWKVKNIAKKE